jgi:cytochrome P450
LSGGPMGNFDTEQADNARLRSLLQPHFSPRRMRALRPRAEELTAGLLSDLAEHGSPADLHQALALPLPIQVICELFGVPYADRDQFRAWSEAAGDVRDRVRSEQGLGGGGIPRYARTDLQIGEVTVRAGKRVLLDNRAANHDPSVFPSSGRVDIARQGPAHISFGHGAHYCLGTPLARIELQAVFSQLLARFPGIRLAVPVEELRVRSDALTGGLTKLPVEW